MNTESNRVSVTVGRQIVDVTKTDGEMMRLALIAYLSRAPDLENEKEAARLSNAVPRIEDSQLRIGSWLLEARDSKLVLARSIIDTPAVLVFQLAYLEGIPGGPWIVSRLGEEVFHLET